MIKLGCVDVDSPIRINLYASTFENKDNIADIITEYNDDVKKAICVAKKARFVLWRV